MKTAMSTLTCNLDRSIWRDLMQKSGMISLMDAQARKQWDNNLEGGDFLRSAKPTFLALLSNCITVKQMCLSGGLSTCLRDYYEITKRTRFASSAKGLL